MSKLKLIIFSDLDGTLLDHFDYQFEPARKTLVKLYTQRIPVILNTSKTRVETESIRQALCLTTPFIVENGAAVFIPKKTFSQQPLDTVDCGEYWRKSFCQPIQVGLAKIRQELSHFKDDYIGFSDLTPQALSSLTGLSEAQAKQAKQREFGEPIKWLGSERSKLTFIDALSALSISVTQGGRFMHIGGKSDKGTAMSWLLSQYIKNFPEHTISSVALGDGENDNAMLEAADIAVQIRSPVHDFPELKHQKNYMQTTAYGPHGWAEAINHILVNNISYPSRTREAYYG